jgi:hypothetical protein
MSNSAPVELYLPKHVAESRSAAPAKPAKMCLAPGDIKNFRVAPGSCIVERLPRPKNMYSPGLLDVPDTAHQKFDKLQYGRVIACGLFCDHQGHIHDNVTGFPLQPGALVEFKPHNPWLTVIHEEVICKCEDVTRWWEPGQWPAEWADWTGTPV